MAEIDKNSPMPIYYQLKEMIKKKIETGEYKPGDRLPTELELCRQYDISRTPVRQALSELHYQGVLFRKPGLGTFISDFTLPPSKDLMRLKAMVPEERWAITLQKAVEVWNDRNPEKQVKLNLLLVGHDEFRFKIVSAVASGNAPDFSLIDSVWMAQFARDHFLLPIDEIDPDWVEVDYRNDFFPVFIDGSSMNDHLYTIYTQADMTVLWYRRDWFEAEKITPPGTWDELAWVAQYFQREEIRQRYGLGPHALAFPAGLKAGETTTYLLLPFLWSTGADVLQDGRVVLDSEAARRAVGFLYDLVHRYHVAPMDIVGFDWNSAPKLFARQQVALALGGSYESAFIKEIAGWSDEQFHATVGFIPVPAGDNGQRSTNAGGMGYAIYRQAKQPELALEILKIATGRELMKEFCLSTDQNPTRMSVYKQLDPENTEKDRFLLQTSEMFNRARMRPVIPEYAMVSQQLQAMLENAVSSRMTAEDAVKRAAEIIGAITGLPQA
jgi:multiple sugar transport system substrate-binding protein